MNILHYFLGFPPYRSGGLTKYAYDLMTAQVDMGHQVAALWPGQMRLLVKAVKIRRRGKNSGVTSYELINPLPVALDEGVADPEAYMTACSGDAYMEFLQKRKPDAIHIHTLMGLHREFLDAAKRLGIRTVFTTHDYYGICPKVTLFRCGDVCRSDNGCADCVACNIQGLSMKKVMLMQSGLYRLVKNNPLVKYLRKQHRGNFFAQETLPGIPADVDVQQQAAKYEKLRQYYVDMLESVDRIHFNSTVTQSVYQRYFTPKDSRVVSITHRHIQDQRDLPHGEDSRLRIACLAPAKPFKGYTVLKKALDELWTSGKQDFVLRMYGPVPEPAPYMQVQEDGFRYEDLPKIMADTDVLVAPSIWYETFGFTVLEALSFGVPVIVTEHVGARDIMGEGGVVLPAGSAQALKEAIAGLTPEALQTMRKAIAERLHIKTWAEFMNENYALYKG